MHQLKADSGQSQTIWHQFRTPMLVNPGFSRLLFWKAAAGDETAISGIAAENRQ